MTMFLIFIVEWTIAAERKECSGSEISKSKKLNIESCASSCKGFSSMFIYGTNDFGANRCNSNGYCDCYCETSASNKGTCNMVDNNGFRLYKYTNRKYIVP